MQGPTQQIQVVNTPQQQNARLSIDIPHRKIRIKQANMQLTYLMLSTEPGRKIIYPPTWVGQVIEYGYEKSEGISINGEGYCAIGYNRPLTYIKQIIIKKPLSSIVQKVIYFSKISIAMKINPKTYFKSDNQKYNFNINTLPPQEITAAEIQQFLLDNIIVSYGQVIKIDVKRNSLMLCFSQNVQIKQNFIINGFQTDSNGEKIFVYWAVTSHRTLFTYQPIRLIQLPSLTKVRHFIIHSEWLVLSTESNVLFIHIYRPALFLNLNDMKVQNISILQNDQIMLMEYKFLHIYQLFSFKPPKYLGKGKTKKIQPFTISFRKKTVLMGGINYSQMFNEAMQQKQIYVFENFSMNNLINKTFLPDRKLQICKKYDRTPIRNLKYLPKNDLFICSCGQSIFLFHLDSSTSSMIASLDLVSPVIKFFQIEYPINMFNCLVHAKNEKHAIRVGFQSYGEIVGTQVNNIQKYGNCLDFHAQGKQVYSTDGDLLVLFDSTQKSKVLYSSQNQQDKITRIALQKQWLAFLLEKKDVMQAYFLEL